MPFVRQSEFEFTASVLQDRNSDRTSYHSPWFHICRIIKQCIPFNNIFILFHLYFIVLICACLGSDSSWLEGIIDSLTGLLQLSVWFSKSKKKKEETHMGV